MRVGTGLLVPLLFVAPVPGPAAVARDAAAGSTDTWAYNLFFVIRAGSQDSPEHPLARTLATNAGVVLAVMVGVGMTILLVLHDRRHAVRDKN